jgi:hypothetical protein
MQALAVPAAHDSSSVVFLKNGSKLKQSEMDVRLAADAGHGHGEVWRTPLPLLTLHRRSHISEQSPQGAFHPEQV